MGPSALNTQPSTLNHFDSAKLLQRFLTFTFIVFYCILLYFMVLQVAEYVYEKVFLNYLRCGSDLSAVRRQIICCSAQERMRCVGGLSQVRRGGHEGDPRLSVVGSQLICSVSPEVVSSR